MADQYHVVVQDGVSNFISQVNMKLGQGYYLHGSPSFQVMEKSTRYIQALIKYTEE